MDDQIPYIVENLYQYLAMPPDPRFWPEHLQHDPVKAHGLYSFYQGLRVGIQLADACLEKL